MTRGRELAGRAYCVVVGAEGLPDIVDSGSRAPCLPYTASASGMCTGMAGATEVSHDRNVWTPMARVTVAQGSLHSGPGRVPFILDPNPRRKHQGQPPRDEPADLDQPACRQSGLTLFARLVVIDSRRPDAATERIADEG